MIGDAVDVPDHADSHNRCGKKENQHGCRYVIIQRGVPQPLRVDELVQGSDEQSRGEVLRFLQIFTDELIRAEGEKKFFTGNT